MSTGGTVTACAVVGAMSMVGLQAVSTAELTWKDLLGGGAAGMVIFVVMIFLRSIAEMRKEHGETVAQVSQDFAETVKSVSNKFGDATKDWADSTERIIEAGRQHNQANMQMLQQLLQEMRDR